MNTSPSSTSAPPTLRATLASVITVTLLCMTATAAGAYEIYSLNGGDNTNCGECHGDYRSNFYISNTDGMVWGNLHNIHRSDMLSGDCDACHIGGDRFPVELNASSGGDGLSAIGCMGCHGRNEDNVPANPEVGEGRTGYGAGLRQQHFVAGETGCAVCHLDADPANYTAVGEEVLPDFYANPGSGHPAMPVDPCNPNGSEDFAGAAEGLDNDGDGLYDGDDTDCNVTGITVANVPEPSTLTLGAIAPNPVLFGGTEIRFSVASAASVDLRLFDVAGRQVSARHLGELPAGWHTADIDVRSADGARLTTGIYLVRIEAGTSATTGRLVLIR